GAQFDQGIPGADARTTLAASPAQSKVAQDGDVFKPADPVAAVRAGRTRYQEVVGLERWRGFGLALQLCTFGSPLPLHHLGQAVDHHIEETAHQQAEHTQQRRGWRAHHRFEHQTTWPSLKIGRYMDTTMPPITVPSTTMMMGSMRLEMPATMSSTSAS